MANTFELIAATTVGSGGASSIDVVSLCIRIVVRSTR